MNTVVFPMGNIPTPTRDVRRQASLWALPVPVEEFKADHGTRLRLIPVGESCLLLQYFFLNK